jgi:DtxR family transcriptional regulator, Mn-dependent transcriptional regulator
MSESEEMYLVSIARLKEEQPERPVPVRRLAKQLDVQPVSANQMVRKLENAGLVRYTPYNGVELTTSGQEQAARILRHRRLWEVFLVEKLNLSHGEADRLACRLEHVTPSDTAERLADFLDKPERSPAGKLIPGSQAGEWLVPGLALTGLKPGETGQVLQVRGELKTREYLSSEGVQAGASVSVWGTGKTGTMLICTEAGNQVHLSKELAELVFVKKKE